MVRRAVDGLGEGEDDLPLAGADFVDALFPPLIELGVREGREEGGECAVVEDAGGVEVHYAVDDGWQVGRVGGQ